MLNGFKEKLLSAVEEIGSDHYRYGKSQKVMMLEDDLELDQTVENDKTASDSDRNVAFVQGHRYVSLGDLKNNLVKTTELEASSFV